MGRFCYNFLENFSAKQKDKQIYKQRMQKGGDEMTGRQLDLCIKKIANGDKDALRQLYDELKNPIFLFALSLTKSYQSAEDAEQETFLNVMQCAHKYRQGTNAKAWIFGIARNCCVDSFKANAKYVSLEADTLSSCLTEDNYFERVENAESLYVAELIE